MDASWTTQMMLSYEVLKIFIDYTNQGIMIHKTITNIETNNLNCSYILVKSK